MAQPFAYLFVVFLGGAGGAALITGNLWPLICVATALFFLLKVAVALDESPPQPAAHGRGRSSR